jgi:hypothetical protein
MDIYITDASGKKFWCTSVAADYAQGERNNMRKRLALIQSGAKTFAFADAATARIVEELETGEDADTMTDDELLTALGL